MRQILQQYKMSSGAMYKLLGGELSPYTTKVAAYLNYKRIPYEDVPTSIQIYEEFIKPKVGWRVMPVLVTPENDVVQDSSEIINLLEKRFSKPNVIPTTPKQHIVALMFELFGDEWMVMPAMHYRWSYPENELYLKYEFGRLTLPQASSEDQINIGSMAYARFKGMLPNIGITKNTAPEIEKSWKALLGDLTKHFDNHRYLLGGQPCVGDFSLAGMIWAHLFGDPIPGYLMKTTAPSVAAWSQKTCGRRSKVDYESAHEVVGGELVKKMLQDEQLSYAANDEIPSTLNPIIHRFCEEFMPILVETRSRCVEYAKKATDDERKMPRIIGELKFKLGNAEEKRGVIPFNILRWQPITDYFSSLTSTDQKNVLEWISQFPYGKEIVTTDLEPCRMERINNFLYLRQSAITKAKL